MREKLVLVGNGMAGMRLLEEVLALAPERYDVTVFGEEPHGCYNRILLSPVLSGEKTFAEIVTHDDAWYVGHGVALRKGIAAKAIRRRAREVVGSDGVPVPYDRLVLATGSRPFIIPVPGTDLPGVVTFREIADVEAMLAFGGPGRRAVVIGGGLLGLEAAWGLMKRGMDVTVAHLKDTLMERQLDAEGGALMRRALEARGLRFLMGANTEAILGRQSVEAVRFADGSEIPAELVVMAAGTRPNTELARNAGIYCERGIVVNDTLQTFDPRIYALGECVQHRRETYGLVAPLYEQARVCANHLAFVGYGIYPGSVCATRLKVTGIEMFSMGHFDVGPGDEEIVLRDAGHGIYRKLVLRNNRIRGGIFYGDVRDSSWYLDLMKQREDVSAIRSTLMFGPASGSETGTGGVADLGDESEVCGCNGVCKGAILKAIQTHGLTTLEEVRRHTKASSSCGSCSGLVEQLLAATVTSYTSQREHSLCGCTDRTSDEVRKAVLTRPFRDVGEVMTVLSWKNPDGCHVCRPALNYYLMCAYPQTYQDDQTSRLVNERLHANIQQDGSFSVVPRMWGGLTTAQELRAIADIADKYRVPTIKVTGGQRIDLLGIARDRLPDVWADLNRAGLVSGHAYGKAIRTVKTCVGKEWCRFGTKDSTALGIALEKLTWGAWTPHKFKMGVSGCPRNCAEATIKDLGVICVESGFDIHIGGNGGMKVRVTDLLCHVDHEEDVLEYCAAFLQLYREEARYLERTAPWVERVGLDYIRSRIVDDERNRRSLQARFLAAQNSQQRDPWAERMAGAPEFSSLTRAPVPDGHNA
ncbi:MAG: nitrite reductase large subunit NirB [Acidiferrobacteraceae bacterium]